MFQAYYREGVALQCLGEEAEALAAYANGLANDAKNEQLLQGLVDAAMKTPLKGQDIFRLYGVEEGFILRNNAIELFYRMLQWKVFIDWSNKRVVLSMFSILYIGFFFYEIRDFV